MYHKKISLKKTTSKQKKKLNSFSRFATLMVKEILKCHTK